MKTVVGIDVGGSTTKIVGFNADGQLIAPIFVRATDQITSIYGALGKFTTENNLTLSDIERIMVPVWVLPLWLRPSIISPYTSSRSFHA
jgi:type II pantothenate kinase